MNRTIACAIVPTISQTIDNKMPKYKIRISADNLRQVKEHLANSRKIQAIKHARTYGKQYPPTMLMQHNTDTREMEEVEDHRVGLRNAKQAIEVLQGMLPVEAADAIISPILKILSFKIETEDGVCEVDVDTLRLRLLDGMSEMSLDEVAHMADLAAYVANWQNGDSEDS